MTRAAPRAVELVVQPHRWEEGVWMDAGCPNLQG